MKRTKNRRRVDFLQLFCIFSLLITFVLTSSMTLFMTYLRNAAQIHFTAQNIGAAATVTFGNVFIKNTASKMKGIGTGTIPAPFSF